MWERQIIWQIQVAWAIETSFDIDGEIETTGFWLFLARMNVWTWSNGNKLYGKEDEDAWQLLKKKKKREKVKLRDKSTLIQLGA